MSKTLELISNQHLQNLPFVCYRKPKGDTLFAYLSKTDTLHYSNAYEEQGFLFAPFDDREKAIIFPLKESEIVQEPIQSYSVLVKENDLETSNHSELEHQRLVKSGVEAIKKGMFNKVVLSRKEISALQGFDFLEVFKKLLNTYDNAFSYVWYHPKVGMWMGATPERLVSLENNKFKTMALAGTQAFMGDVNPHWGEKERQEHQYVVD